MPATGRGGRHPASDDSYPLAAGVPDFDDEDTASRNSMEEEEGEDRGLETGRRSRRSRPAGSGAGAAARTARFPAAPSPSRYTPVPLSDDEGHGSDRQRHLSSRAGPPGYPSGDDDRPGSTSPALPASLHPGDAVAAAGSFAGSSAVAASSSSSSGPSTPSRTADRRPLPQARDGVFANLSAKPALNAEDEEKEEDVPPPYETAAADPTPPYFDTTVITAGATDDEILVEGLPVGSGFVFIWNLLISMSFQFAGFLLTYLLHSSHAGKNGSRAGLGITLIQYGFYLRSQTYSDYTYGYYSSNPTSSSSDLEDEVSPRAELLSYIIMVLGWFIAIRSTSEYIRARKMAAIIAYHPDTVVV